MTDDYPAGAARPASDGTWPPGDRAAPVRRRRAEADHHANHAHRASRRDDAADAGRRPADEPGAGDRGGAARRAERGAQAGVSSWTAPRASASRTSCSTAATIPCTWKSWSTSISKMASAGQTCVMWVGLKASNAPYYGHTAPCSITRLGSPICADRHGGVMPVLAPVSTFALLASCFPTSPIPLCVTHSPLARQFRAAEKRKKV